MDPREELQQLREQKRLEELEAKASGNGQAQSAPAPEAQAGQDPETAPHSALKTGLDTAANFMLAGHMPQLTSKLAEFLAPKMLTPDAQKQLGSYTDVRDKEIDQLKNSQAAHPDATTAGSVAGFVGSTALPGAAISKAGNALKLGRAGQAALALGAGGLTAGAQNPGDIKGVDQGMQWDERLPAAATGAAITGATMGLAAGGKKLWSMGKDQLANAASMTPGQASQYVADPKGVGKMASMMENGQDLELTQQMRQKALEAAQKLRDYGTGPVEDKLQTLLQGKSAPINPQAAMGGRLSVDKDILRQVNKVSPRPTIQVPNPRLEGAGAYLNAGEPETVSRLGARVMPDSISMPGDKLLSGKRALDSAARYRPGALYSASESAAQADTKAKANVLRTALYGMGDDVKDLLGTQQRTVKLGSALEKSAGRSPLKALTGSTPDKRAMLQEIDKLVGTDLGKQGDRMAAAKAMNPLSGDDDRTLNAIRKLGGRIGLRTMGAAESVGSKLPVPSLKNPMTKQAIMELMYGTGKPKDDE